MTIEQDIANLEAVIRKRESLAQIGEEQNRKDRNKLAELRALRARGNTAEEAEIISLIESEPFSSLRIQFIEPNGTGTWLAYSKGKVDDWGSLPKLNEGGYIIHAYRRNCGVSGYSNSSMFWIKKISSIGR